MTAIATTRLFVQIVSAPWCKRCAEIKPQVVQLCKIAGAMLEEVNYDALEETDSLKASVTALPTVRLLVEQAGRSSGWKAYTPKEMAIWEDQMRLYAVAAPSADDMDF